MTAKAKARLWETIKANHKEFAEALVEIKAAGRSEVRINGYPKATEAWIEQALQDHRPEMHRMIEEDLKPMIEAFEDSEARIEVRVDELIAALMGGEEEGKADGRKNAA